MIALDIQTWAAAATIISTVAAGGFAMMRLMLTKFEQIDAKFVTVHHENQTTRDELGARITEVRDELGARIEQARQEAKAENKATRDELGTRITEVRAELTDIRASLRALEQRFFELLLPRRPLSTGTDDS